MEINATIFLQLFIFLMLLAWLSGFLFGPLMKLFEERERRIEGASAEALTLRASADAAAGQIEARMAEAQSEARKILQGLREKGQTMEKSHVEKARDKAQGKIEDARADLFAATEDARTSLKDDARQIADSIVVKVLGRAA